MTAPLFGQAKPTGVEQSLRSVQFSQSVRGCLAWTSLGIILFLRSLYSKFSLTGLDFFGYYFISSIIIFKVQSNA